MRKINVIFEEIKKRITPDGSLKGENPEQDMIIHAVEIARKEWHYARDFFNQIEEPELVDHAIYAIEAAEKKYMFLLRQAREMGCRAYFSNIDEESIII